MFINCVLVLYDTIKSYADYHHHLLTIITIIIIDHYKQYTKVQHKFFKHHYDISGQKHQHIDILGLKFISMAIDNDFNLSKKAF